MNVRARSEMLLNENIEVNLHDLGFGEGFLDTTPKAYARKK